MRVLGNKFQRLTQKCDNIYFRMKIVPTSNERGTHSQKRGKKTTYLFRPYYFMGVLLIAMYIAWIFLCILPQINGDLLCQSIYFQLDDEVNQTLSFYSGVYDLEKGSKKRHTHYHSYKERKHSIASGRGRAMIVRFCVETQQWAFFLDDEYNRDECDESSYLIISPESKLEAKFDIFQNDVTEWSVRGKTDFGDDEFMSLHNFYMKCHDDIVSIDWAASELCSEIKMDERTEPFISTIEWPKAYKLLTNSDETAVSVYNKPVFYENSSMNDGFDFILFAGKRWMLLSSLTFDNTVVNNTLESLTLYLKDNFHGKWSKYEAAFFSEPVFAGTPQNTMNPADLNWYFATPKFNKTVLQTADNKRKVPSILL